MKQHWIVWVLVIFFLGACGDDEKPLPTAISREDALATAGFPTEKDLTLTATYGVPTATNPVTWTPSPTITLTPSETFTPSITPSETPTLSPIQETEIFLYQRSTDLALTATAQVPPTVTRTPTQTALPSSPTASPTPTATHILPNVAPPNRVIFTSNRLGTNDLWVMNLDGTNPMPLQLALESNENVGTCSPDGQQFVFDSDRGGDLEIYLARYDEAAPRPLTDTEGENFHPVWSPDGSQIAFVSSRSGNPDIWVMDNGGGNPTALITSSGAEQNPQWSPDGTQLYYASNREGQYDIYRYDFSSETETRLTNTENRDETAPAMGFDFQTLVYIADVETGVSDTGALWVDNLIDAPVASVSAEGRVDHPVWIANGQLLMSADLGGITHVLLVDLLAASRTILTNIGPRNFWPHPCYIESDLAVAVLPTGIPPTETPLANEAFTSAYTAVVNPGPEWQPVTQSFEPAHFNAMDDPRGQTADIFFENQRIIFTWVSEGDEFSAAFLPEILDGALEVRVTNYTRNALPQELLQMQSLAFAVREFILKEMIPIGTYRAENLVFEEDSLQITLSIPPQE